MPLTAVFSYRSSEEIYFPAFNCYINKGFNSSEFVSLNEHLYYFLVCYRQNNSKHNTESNHSSSSTYYIEDIIYVNGIQNEVLGAIMKASCHKVWPLNEHAAAAAACKGDGWLFSAVVLRV
jgi:hypothetical protein